MTTHCAVCLSDVLASQTRACGTCSQAICLSAGRDWLRVRLETYALEAKSFVFMPDSVARAMFTCPSCRGSPEALTKHTGFCTLPNGQSGIMCSFTFRGEEVAVALMSEAGQGEVVCILPTARKPSQVQYRLVAGRTTGVVLENTYDPGMEGWKPNVKWSTMPPTQQKRLAPPTVGPPASSNAECIELYVNVVASIRAAETDEQRLAACAAAALLPALPRQRGEQR